MKIVDAGADGGLSTTSAAAAGSASASDPAFVVSSAAVASWTWSAQCDWRPLRPE